MHQCFERSRNSYRLAPAMVGAVINLTAFSLIAGRNADAKEYLRSLLVAGQPTADIFRSEVARRVGQYGVAAAQMTTAIPAELGAQGGDEVVSP